MDPDYVCPIYCGLSRAIDCRPETEIELDNVTLEVVDELCYLGDMVGTGGGCVNAIPNRCGIAWGKLRNLLPFLKSIHLPLLIRSRLLSTCVRTTMLHGSETWGPNKVDLQRLRRNDRSVIGWICGVRPQDDTDTANLLAKRGLADIDKVLRPRRLRLFYHAMHRNA